MLGFDQNTESKPKIDISGNIFDFLKYKIVWHGSSLELRKAWPLHTTLPWMAKAVTTIQNPTGAQKVKLLELLESDECIY